MPAVGSKPGSRRPSAVGSERQGTSPGARHGRAPAPHHHGMPLATCDEDTPHLITNVLTSDSTVQDIKATDLVHDTLAAKNLLPGEHLLDAGHIDGPAPPPTTPVR